TSGAAVVVCACTPHSSACPARNASRILSSSLLSCTPTAPPETSTLSLHDALPIFALRELGAVLQRGRRGVVGATPQHELLLAELGERLGLVLALQRAVVALVQPPAAVHRDPVAVAGLQGDLRGAARAPLRRAAGQG